MTSDYPGVRRSKGSSVQLSSIVKRKRDIGSAPIYERSLPCTHIHMCIYRPASRSAIYRQSYYVAHRITHHAQYQLFPKSRYLESQRLKLEDHRVVIYLSTHLSSIITFHYVTVIRNINVSGSFKEHPGIFR